MPSFVVSGLLVPEQQIFEGIFIIYGRGGYLGRMTKMPNNISFPLPKGLHINFGFDWQSSCNEEDLVNG